MLLNFRNFLEVGEAGHVHTAMIANTAVDDGFKRIRSKYMADNIPQRGGEPFDPEARFGKKRYKRKARFRARP